MVTEDRGSDSDRVRVWATASVQTLAMAGDLETDLVMEDAHASDVSVTGHWAGVSAAGDWDLLFTTVAILDIPIRITRLEDGAAITILSRSR